MPGIDGKDGIRGYDGPPGENAILDYSQIKNEKGEQGEKGEMGFPGMKGEAGANGAQGYPGPKGMNFYIRRFRNNLLVILKNFDMLIFWITIITNHVIETSKMVNNIKKRQAIYSNENFIFLLIKCGLCLKYFQKLFLRSRFDKFNLIKKRHKASKIKSSFNYIIRHEQLIKINLSKTFVR